MSKKPSNCPVCFESLETEKYALICSHWVHMECIKKQIKDECPLCRTKLNLKDKTIYMKTDNISDIDNRSEILSENLTVTEPPSDIFSDDEECMPWRERGFTYKEEDLENYDEENPDDDSVYYD